MNDDHQKIQFANTAIEAASHDLYPAVYGWYTDEKIRANFRSSLTDEIGRIDDKKLAAGYAKLCPVEGTTPQDYLNALVPYSSGEALIGIRFKGLNV